MQGGNSDGLDQDYQQRRLADRGKGDVVSWLEDGQVSRFLLLNMIIFSLYTRAFISCR